MKEQVLDILKEGINDIEAVKKQHPKMYTQDVIDALRRLQERISELTLTDSEQFKMFDLMQYYMEYCGLNGYVTPREWIENHKHF